MTDHCEHQWVQLRTPTWYAGVFKFYCSKCLAIRAVRDLTHGKESEALR